MNYNIMSQAAIHKKMTVEGVTRALRDWTTTGWLAAIHMAYRDRILRM